jgi:hypothetical protein
MICGCRRTAGHFDQGGVIVERCARPAAELGHGLAKELQAGRRDLCVTPPSECGEAVEIAGSVFAASYAADA